MTDTNEVPEVPEDDDVVVIIHEGVVSMFYSAAERGWFHPSTHLVMPDDSVEVPYDEYLALLEGQSFDNEIVPDERGYPTLVKRAPPTLEQITVEVLVLRDRLLTEAGLRIAPLQDAVDLGEATKEEEDALHKWKQYRIDINRIPQQGGYPVNVVWPVQPQVTE